MHAKLNPAILVVTALLVIFLGGCASSSSAPSSSAASSGAISIQQPPMTGYMRSRIGTPDELSPLAPPQARNVHKVGDHWTCELNGRTLIFDGANWVPQP
jgi:hypothetical protein